MLKKLILIAGSMVLPLILVTCTTMSQPEHVLHQSAMPDKTIHRKTLKVLSLNLAHGRKDGTNQLFLRESRICRILRWFSNERMPISSHSRKQMVLHFGVVVSIMLPCWQKKQAI